MCTTWPSRAKQNTPVHCALGVHSVTQLKYPVHCYYFHLWKSKVYKEYSALHERIHEVICPNTKSTLHQCRKWRRWSTHTENYVRTTCPRCAKMFIVVHCQRGLIFLRYSNAQCTNLFLKHVSTLCTATIVQQNGGALTEHVPTISRFIKKLPNTVFSSL